MAFFKRKTKSSSFSITQVMEPSQVPRAQRRRRKRTLLQVLRSLCCTVRHDDEPSTRESYMYEVPSVDSYYKPSTDTQVPSEELNDEVRGDNHVLSHVTPVTQLENCSAFSQMVGAMTSSSVVLGFVRQWNRHLAILDALNRFNLQLAISAWLAIVCASLAILQPVLKECLETEGSPSASLQIAGRIDQHAHVPLDSEIPLLDQGELSTMNDDELIIGQGSSSTVTLQRLRSNTDSLVAVKRLSSDQPKSILIKEANILRKLVQCPAFPQLIGFIDHEDSPSMVLEFVGDWNKLTSISVFDALNNLTPRLLVSEWFAVARDVAEGLSILHNAGYIHTDLHNNNIILCRYPANWNPDPRISWQAKIIDLGAAESIDATSPPMQLSEQEKAIYREHLPYQAPELVDGITGPTVASDIFAYGHLIDDIGYFSKINILCKVARWCMGKEPSHRKQLTTVARELSYHIARYQNKERWGY